METIKNKITEVLKEIDELNTHYLTYSEFKVVYEDGRPRQHIFDTEMYVGHKYGMTVKLMHERMGKALELVKDYNEGQLFIDHDTCGFGVDNLKIRYYETDEDKLVRLIEALKKGKEKIEQRKKSVIADYKKAKEFFKF